MAPEYMPFPQLQPTLSGGGVLHSTGVNAWLLEIPAGKEVTYRLAQLDDYSGLPRNRFPWLPPLEVRLEARASSAGVLPGTWGFGLWNDPFSLSLGMGGGTRRFPALPNCAWFFFASPENYLSLRDDLPANGALAATFRSRRISAPLVAACGLSLPLLAVPLGRRWLRQVARGFVWQDAESLYLDVSLWHDYRIVWQPDRVYFLIDDVAVLVTRVSPFGPLGMVLWVDNQFAALPPDGLPRYGTLANPEPAWIEARGLKVASGFSEVTS